MPFDEGASLVLRPENHAPPATLIGDPDVEAERLAREGPYASRGEAPRSAQGFEPDDVEPPSIEVLPPPAEDETASGTSFEGRDVAALSRDGTIEQVGPIILTSPPIVTYELPSGAKLKLYAPEEKGGAWKALPEADPAALEEMKALVDDLR